MSNLLIPSVHDAPIRKLTSNVKTRKATAVVYCESNFGSIDGKTANGLVRHSEKYKILSVIDSTQEGRDSGTVLDNKPNGIPICHNLAASLLAASSSRCGTFARPTTAAVCMNTSHLDDETAKREVEQLEQRLGIPVTDPVRQGTVNQSSGISPPGAWANPVSQSRLAAASAH